MSQCASKLKHTGKTKKKIFCWQGGNEEVHDEPTQHGSLTRASRFGLDRGPEEREIGREKRERKV